MITKIIDERSASAIPEESDDLLTLRRIISTGDKIISSTTRVIKQEKDYSRPDRGERVRIKIALDVEKISLDNVLDKLRIQGTITDSNNESVRHGSYHSILVHVNDAITITKKKWSATQRRLLKSNNKRCGFLLVGIDTTDCGIAKLNGTHLEIMPNIYSGSSGKRYKTSFKIEKFFQDVVKAISSVIKEKDSVIIFGPGQTCKKFANYFEKTTTAQKVTFQVVEGIDSGGEDGIYTFTKSKIMKEIISDSKLAQVSGIIDQVMVMASKKSRRFSMGYKETKKANELGAIESLVFSDKIIQEIDEQEIIDFLNDAEGKGIRSFGVDSTTDLGLRVNGLGGILGILRFPID